jgi:membrane associated rhomboid family serine protease
MTGAGTELSIRSHNGLLRDLIPIYSLYQLLPNLVAVGLVLWLGHWLGYFLPLLLVAVMLGWVFQFVLRPSAMTVSKEQAAWLEAVLEEQGFYGKSEADGRWRLIETPSWRRWPHQFIAFVHGDAVTVIAPREVMETLRAAIELAEEHGELSYASEAQPFAFAPPETEPEPPWHMHVPAVVLGAACVVAMIWLMFTGGTEGMLRWGLSARALSEGRFETIVLHMFAHGGGMHLWMNLAALAAIGAVLTSRLGQPPLNWLRFWLLFLLSALAGAALFLALHPAGSVPMVGASGGLYGLIGLLIRTPANGGAVLAVKSTRIRRMGWDLAKQNAFLFVFLALISWSSGGAGGLAWEAHLGGFLFGLCVGPKMLPRPAATAPSEERGSETFVPAD